MTPDELRFGQLVLHGPPLVGAARVTTRLIEARSATRMAHDLCAMLDLPPNATFARGAEAFRLTLRLPAVVV